MDIEMEVGRNASGERTVKMWASAGDMPSDAAEHTLDELDAVLAEAHRQHRARRDQRTLANLHRDAFARLNRTSAERPPVRKPQRPTSEAEGLAALHDDVFAKWNSPKPRRSMVDAEE